MEKLMAFCVVLCEVALWFGRLALPAATIKYMVEVLTNKARYFSLRYYLYQGGAATFMLILPVMLINYTFSIAKDIYHVAYEVPAYVGTEEDLLLAMFGYIISYICSCLSRKSIAKYMAIRRNAE